MQQPRAHASALASRVHCVISRAAGLVGTRACVCTVCFEGASVRVEVRGAGHNAFVCACGLTWPGVPLGAGLSVASGIPTFRGTEDNAVWNKNIIEVGTRRAFLRDPRGWYVILARPVSVAPYSLNIDVLGETVRMIPRRIADLTFAQTHKHTKTHAHAHTHTRTHTRTRTRTRTRTHTRTHARSLFLSFSLSLSLSLSLCVCVDLQVQHILAPHPRNGAAHKHHRANPLGQSTTHQPHIIPLLPPFKMALKSGFEICFAIGSQYR